MSELKIAVAKGFLAQGIAAEPGQLDDMTVEVGGLRVSVLVDETDRVVRAEAPVCYPADDFTPDLARAIDHLNRQRAGIVFHHDEARRAVIGRTVWSAPGRNPSPGQLHLLVALLLRARARDGEMLQRIAEGEAGWDEVAGAEAGGAAPGAEPEPAPPAAEEEPGDDLLFDDTRLSVTSRVGSRAQLEAELLGGPAAAPTPAEPGGAGRASTTTRRSRPSGRHERPAQPDRLAGAPPDPAAPSDDVPIQRRSRLELEMAISSSERTQLPRQDLTLGRRRRARAVKVLLLLGALGVGGWYAFDLLYQPAPVLDARQVEEARRRAMEPGAELLRLELLDPLAQDRVRPALDALGPDRTRALLEDFVVRETEWAARERAWNLWVEAGHLRAPGAPLRLLQALAAARRPADDRLAVYLVNALREAPPADEALIAALPWAQGQVWLAVVELLGRPGDGAGARAAALLAQRPRDTPDLPVLRALVLTGEAPPEALGELVTGRGPQWATGEGLPLLLELLGSDPRPAAGLLAHAEEPVRLVGLELLSRVPSPRAGELVSGALRDASLKVRLRAAQVLGELRAPAAAWPLATVYAQRDLEPPFREELERTFQRLPDEAVEQLTPRLTAESRNERYVAVKALAAMRRPASVAGLFRALGDSDPRMRIYVLERLEEQRAASPRALDAGLAQLRTLALRREEFPQVRERAAQLYKAVTGRDP